MSPRSSKPRAAGGEPAARPDVYVGLLFVVVAALAIGCLFLALELGKYGWSAAG